MIKFFKKLPKFHLIHNYSLFFWRNQPFLDIVYKINNIQLDFIFIIYLLIMLNSVISYENNRH